MKMRGRLNRTMSVTEPNSVHSSGLSNTLPSGKNISKQGTYNNTSSNTNKENVSGNVRMFQHDTLPQETYFHHNVSSSSVNLGEDVLHNSKLNKSGGTGEVGTMTTGGSGGNNDGPSSKLGSIAMSSSTLPMSLSSLQQNVRTLPLPKLGLSSPWFNAGKKEFSLLSSGIGKPFVRELVKDKRKYLMPIFGRCHAKWRINDVCWI